MMSRVSMVSFSPLVQRSLSHISVAVKLSSLILLSENYEEANNSNKRDKFIRNMMIKLIEKMTPDLEE